MPPGVDFKGKIGPFPAYVWGIIVAAMGLALYFWSKRGSSSTAQDSSTVTLDPNGYQTAGITGGSASSNSIVSGDNNQAWLSRAAKAVADTYSLSPTDTYAALQLWLSGQDITKAQKDIVDKAIRIEGNPPESVQGTSTVLNPPDTTTPPTGTPTTAGASFVTFYKDPVGSIAAIFSNKTKVEFANQAALKAWQVKNGKLSVPIHPVTKSIYNSFATARVFS